MPAIGVTTRRTGWLPFPCTDRAGVDEMISVTEFVELLKARDKQALRVALDDGFRLHQQYEAITRGTLLLDDARFTKRMITSGLEVSAFHGLAVVIAGDAGLARQVVVLTDCSTWSSIPLTAFDLALRHAARKGHAETIRALCEAHTYTPSSLMHARSLLSSVHELCFRAIDDALLEQAHHA